MGEMRWRRVTHIAKDHHYKKHRPKVEHTSGIKVLMKDGGLDDGHDTLAAKAGGGKVPPPKQLWLAEESVAHFPSRNPPKCRRKLRCDNKRCVAILRHRQLAFVGHYSVKSDLDLDARVPLMNPRRASTALR